MDEEDGDRVSGRVPDHPPAPVARRMDEEGGDGAGRRGKAAFEAGRPSEDEVVQRLAAIGWKGNRAVLLGPGDDAAVLRGGLVISVDMSVEGVHFRFGWVSAEEAGFRAGAAALSDMAAMGADPVSLLVSMALPMEGAVGVADGSGGAEALQRGVAAAGARVGVPIVGGDVCRSPGPAVVDVVAVGRAARPLARRGARPGESLWVSGALGGAAAAVAAWNRGGRPNEAARNRFARPPDRIGLGRALAAEGLASALIDVSDGVAADARRIADRSGVRLCIVEKLVPVDAAAGGDLNFALQGGEDYELMFTVPSGAAGRIPPLGRELSVPLTRIGVVERGGGVVMERNGKRRSGEGFCGHDHFAGPGPAGAT